MLHFQVVCAYCLPMPSALSSVRLLLFSALLIPMSSAQESKSPLIIAHRGASGAAPENTLAAFREAWEKEADGIEGDFRLSSDGRIMCIHDEDTKRTAGKKLAVAKTSFAELRKLDVGSWKHARYADERIPTLHEILEILPAGKRFFIEIKCGPEIVEPLAKTLAMIDKPGLESQLTIITFNEEVVRQCRKRFPEIPCNWLVSFKKHKLTGRWGPGTDTVIKGLNACSATGLGCSAKLEMVSAAFVKQLRSAELQFHCWTVDDPALARRFAALGVDSITTNEPKAIRTALSGE